VDRHYPTLPRSGGNSMDDLPRWAESALDYALAIAIGASLAWLLVEGLSK
jgi:hypothetical protein